MDLDVAVCDKSQTIDRFTQTVVIIVPLTSNLLRSNIPGTFTIPAEEGGLTQESVALCYQIADNNLENWDFALWMVNVFISIARN
nr:hypothetical protein [Chamaesiphon sp. VAR_48_metabat_403]